jgi:hypothetical protein
MDSLRWKIKSGFIIVCFLLLSSGLSSQNLDDMLGKYTGENGVGFMQPVSNAFGALYNSGWYHMAGVPESGLHIHVGFVGSVVWIPGDQRVFKATTEDYFQPTITTDKAPTIFGRTRGFSVDGDGGTEYYFPGGLDINALAYTIPQITIGSLFGTELIIRYFGIRLGGEFGKLRIGGLGIRHNLDQYLLPESDVELSAGIFAQAFKIGTQFHSRSFMFSVQSGYTLKKWNFYGALGFRTSNADIEYVNDDGEELNFDLEKNNTLYFTAGAAYHLGPVVFSSDINFSDYTVLSFTLGFEFNKD